MHRVTICARSLWSIVLFVAHGSRTKTTSRCIMLGCTRTSGELITRASASGV